MDKEKEFKKRFPDNGLHPISSVWEWIKLNYEPIENEQLKQQADKLQIAYREIYTSQSYPMSTKGKPKADDILLKYFPFLKP